ncbi:MAG: glycine cleavage system aminomethyltransferase GcvT [Clostridiaceae bacterium]|nr:glycine cleavage system aminomethyltransferase GcvT [Clostridiaceae bacterium]
MKKTPLYEKHIELGGKIVEFSGWSLPVQYKSILEEHEKVRNCAGLFDVSHMGEILVEGTNAEEFLQHLLTNDIAGMKEGKVRYSPVCYPDGGTVDDILVYKFSSSRYLLVVNASNTEKDYLWMLDNSTGNVSIKKVSENYALLALQGPKAIAILKKLTTYPLENMKPFSFEEKVDISGIKALVSRTGYTGEDGFEIYVVPEHAVTLWNRLLEAGEEEKLVPAGLGARDTLRLEAGMPLYGHEISKEITPVEAALSKFVKFEKKDFIGKKALLSKANSPSRRTLIGFEMIERGIPRNNYEVASGDRKIGFVTSGSFSPTLKKNIGMALVSNEYANIGNEIDIVIRNKAAKAKIIQLPFYTRKGG